jgi:hypothetical protein
LDEETTVQALIGRALNDLLERSGFGRPASEKVLPRGGRRASSFGGRRKCERRRNPDGKSYAGTAGTRFAGLSHVMRLFQCFCVED